MTTTSTYRRHSVLADRLLQYKGAITRAQAEDLFGENALKACIAEGSITRILPEVYVHSSLTNDREVRIRAASRWCEPHGAITGVAGLWAWGLQKEPPKRVTVQLPPPLHLERPRWIRVVRPQGPLEIQTHGRVRVVGQAQAVVQAWSEALPRDRVGLLVDAVHRSELTADEVAAAAMLRPRITARGQLHSVLGHLDGGVTSYLEYHARTVVFPKNRFPELVFQHDVVALGRHRRLDAFAPDVKLYLEFDGREHHSKEEDRLADLERDAALSTLGYSPLHFTYDDLMYRPQWCRDIYVAARAARLRG